MENVKGSLLPCYNSSEGQPLDRIIDSQVYCFGVNILGQSGTVDVI